MKWRNLHNSVGSDDLKKPESGPRRGRPRIRVKTTQSERFFHVVAIGRASRPFPRSKPDRCLSTHPAFQFDPATGKLQADG